jgi:hypothetical protein
MHPLLTHVPSQYAAQARASLGAALAVAQHAPAGAGHALSAAARQAFIAGSDHALLVAVAAVTLGAIVAAVYLPSRAIVAKREREAAAAEAPAQPAVV